MDQRERDEREREALELGLAGLEQGYMFSPEGSGAWHVYRALIPEFRSRLAELERRHGRPTFRPRRGGF